MKKTIDCPPFEIEARVCIQLLLEAGLELIYNSSTRHIHVLRDLGLSSNRIVWTTKMRGEVRAEEVPDPQRAAESDMECKVSVQMQDCR
jgi:hypothetical protein